MPAQLFDVGDQIVLTARFYSADDPPVLTSPATVEAKVKNPAGTVTTLSATQLSPGVYRAVAVLNTPGDWWVRVAGTAGLLAAVERMFTVRTSAFP